MNDLQVISSPNLWPTFPYLRVERRTEQRPGQPFCFVKASNEQEVEPVVLMGPTWPPADDLVVEEAFRFAYPSLEELAAAGWKVVYLF